MHHSKMGRALRRASVCVCGATLATASASGAAQIGQPPAVPYRVQMERIELTINPDRGFTERVERHLQLISLAGVQYTRRMDVAAPDVGFPGMFHPMGEDRVVEAYTLKPDGQHIPAVADEVPSMPPAVMARLAKQNIKPHMHPPQWFSFPQAEVGDVLVITYQGDYPPLQDGSDDFIHDEMLPTTLPIDKAEITLNAPAAMTLHFRLNGISPSQTGLSGGMHHWTWQYSHPIPIAYNPGMSKEEVMAAVHISTLPSDDAEADFMDRRNARLLAKSMPGGKFGCTWPNTVNDGPNSMRWVQTSLATNYMQSPFSFEQMIDGLNSPDCVFDDGRPKMAALPMAYGAAFSQQGWENGYEYIQELKRRFPQHGFVALAEAEYWVAYAWEARGGGYSSSVTREGWKLFRERLEKAEKVLLDSKPYAAGYPLWYDSMLDIEHLLDRPAHDQAVVLKEGLERYPRYYPLYFTAVNFMLPRWDGSWEAVDRFVNWSVDATKQQEGQTMYARLYWFAYQSLQPNEVLFRDTMASWPRMKQSFQELIARNPKSAWNLNNFAHFACVAGDKATYRKLRRKVGKSVVPEAWDSAPTLEVCRERFGV